MEGVEAYLEFLATHELNRQEIQIPYILSHFCIDDHSAVRRTGSSAHDVVRLCKIDAPDAAEFSLCATGDARPAAASTLQAHDKRAGALVRM